MAGKAARTPSPWILSPAADAILFIGAPVAAMAAFLPLRAFLRSETISLLLVAFFTFGHHLPGFLRAYGDAELFARYRTRFLLAPPLVFALAWWFSARDLHGLLLVVFAWDIWHVLMQHYGFLRIYDAKLGNIEPREAHLDQAVSLSWYITFIALSPHYRHDFFVRAYSSGLPFLPAGATGALEAALLAVSAAITCVYAAHHYRRWRAGRLNTRKIATLAIFLAATWYLYVALDDFLVGFAVWSAFHCIQYYGFVWVYNRKRVAVSPQQAGRFLRFLFRPSAASLALYLALIAAYGAINWFSPTISNGALRQLVAALIVTSGTLHYYYDGFIWKVREDGTRRVLEVSAAGPPRAAWSSATVQAVVAGTAVAALAALEMAHAQPSLRVREAVAAVSPNLAAAHRNLGDAYRAANNLPRAVGSYSRAAELAPGDVEAWHKLGLTLAALGRPGEARGAFEHALTVDGGHREAHYNLAVLLAAAGDAPRATSHLERAFPAGDPRALRALEREPGAADLFNNLALGQLQAGRRAQAIELFERALAAAPDHASANLNLGNLLFYESRYEESERHLRRALAAAPRDPAANNSLGHLLVRTGRLEEARRRLEFAAEQPDERVRASAAQALRALPR